MGRKKKEPLINPEGEVIGESGKKPVIDRSLIKAPINEWVQTPENTFIEYSGNIVIIPFDKIFKNPEWDTYRQFNIDKDSYSNQLDLICRYLNFFINAYDTEQELLMVYLNIKFAIDKEMKEDDGAEVGIHFRGDEQFDDFVEYVYDIMFTDSIIDKISRLTEDNYLDDIEDGENGSKYVSKDKKYLESLEFTNEHIKTLLKISFGIKMMTPVIFHYASVNKLVLNKKTTYLYRAFLNLFTIFSTNCDMYNKTFVYVSVGIRKTSLIAGTNAININYQTRMVTV